ncbi:MAG TPA: methyltransferase domain-containing protein [Candidatus Limnocylindrales bacterium]|nr:methyltransferase domain-containing protein [Candidatus Limnocylindrales bacterium]
MTFNVAASAYDAFMGRFSRLLSPQMVDLAGLTAGQQALDVGCGPGALTSVLVERLGAANVAAVDPSAPFLEAVRTRNPGVTVVEATAEALPFPDGAFDAALAQLVVHFMHDPVGGIREMARVTRSGGAVAACVWDHAGALGPLALFWTTARELDPHAADESDLPGARQGHLGQLFGAAGLTAVHETALAADLTMPDFDAWWSPFERGVGPAGAYVAGLAPDARAALRDRCRAKLPDGEFVIQARAWAARGTVAAR